MNIDWLQKAAVVVVIWFVCFVLTLSEVHDLVWPTERRVAAIQAGQYPVDVAPPLPPAVWITIFATPTGIAGALVVIYRNRTNRSRQQRASNERQPS